jgi:hypothetical protein
MVERPYRQGVIEWFLREDVGAKRCWSRRIAESNAARLVDQANMERPRALVQTNWTCLAKPRIRRALCPRDRDVRVCRREVCFLRIGDKTVSERDWPFGRDSALPPFVFHWYQSVSSGGKTFLLRNNMVHFLDIHEPAANFTSRIA